MRKYLEILKTSIKNMYAYKFEFTIYVIATLVSMSVFYFVWTAIYSYNQAETLGGLTLQQIITYAVISMAILPVIWSSADRMMYWDINQGQITGILTKPLKVQPYIFSRESSVNIMSFFTQTVLSITLAAIIFKIAIPPLFNVMAFAASVFLSMIISFSLAFLVWLSAFWTEKADGIRRFKDAIMNLFGGAIIPLYLFPAWMQPVLFLLPLQAIYNIPLSIFIEKISGAQIISALLVQMFWAAVLLLAGHMLWKRARKKYSAHGG